MGIILAAKYQLLNKRSTNKKHAYTSRLCALDLTSGRPSSVNGPSCLRLSKACPEQAKYIEQQVGVVDPQFRPFPLL